MLQKATASGTVRVQLIHCDSRPHRGLHQHHLWLRRRWTADDGVVWVDVGQQLNVLEVTDPATAFFALFATGAHMYRASFIICVTYM